MPHARLFQHSFGGEVLGVACREDAVQRQPLEAETDQPLDRLGREPPVPINRVEGVTDVGRPILRARDDDVAVADEMTGFRLNDDQPVLGTGFPAVLLPFIFDGVFRVLLVLGPGHHVFPYDRQGFVRMQLLEVVAPHFP